MQPRVISSPHNPSVKSLLQLRDGKHRKLAGKILIDGNRSIIRALNAGWKLELVATSIEDIGMIEAIPHSAQHAIDDWIQLPEKVFDKVSYGESSSAVAIAARPDRSIASLQLKFDQPSLIVVLDQVEKPGNIGAIVRTCDAMGVSALLLCDSRCELWNPNAIRSSSGAMFSFPIAEGSLQEVEQFLKTNVFDVYAARLENSHDYSSVAFPQHTALIFGNEADGLKDRWTTCKGIHIPMKGMGDSLNVSIACAIMTAEVLRRRKQL
jgi:RNA methyltransferase, TrmH family